MKSPKDGEACPECRARLAYGERHWPDCPWGPELPADAAERMLREKQDFEFREAVAEEHF